jgi:hypothetical protein
MHGAYLTMMLEYYKWIFEMAALGALLGKIEDRIYG